MSRDHGPSVSGGELLAMLEDHDGGFLAFNEVEAVQALAWELTQSVVRESAGVVTAVAEVNLFDEGMFDQEGLTREGYAWAVGRVGEAIDGSRYASSFSGEQRGLMAVLGLKVLVDNVNTGDIEADEEFRRKNKALIDSYGRGVDQSAQAVFELALSVSASGIARDLDAKQRLQRQERATLPQLVRLRVMDEIARVNEALLGQNRGMVRHLLTAVAGERPILPEQGEVTADMQEWGTIVRCLDNASVNQLLRAVEQLMMS